MYPLLELGPLRLSSGGLLLIVALMLGAWLFERIARRRGGDPLAELAERCTLPALFGALVGARLWYGLLSWELYSRSPGLFLAFRIGDFAWPGALLGGALAGYFWCRRSHGAPTALADAAALALPPVHALAACGMLLSGEALGAPADLPWSIPLLGAARHPTQIYFMLAALLGWALLAWFERRAPRPGALAALFVGWQGATLLLIEALRADSLILAQGVRAAQVAGLLLLLAALWWRRRISATTVSA